MLTDRGHGVVGKCEPVRQFLGEPRPSWSRKAAAPPSGPGPPSRLPALTTSMAHRRSLALTCTSYSSPGPACRMTLAQASLSARAMSARVSGVTPRVCQAAVEDLATDRHAEGITGKKKHHLEFHATHL